MLIGRPKRELGIFQAGLEILRPFNREPWRPFLHIWVGRLVSFPPEGQLIRPGVDWQGIWWRVEFPVRDVIMRSWTFKVPFGLGRWLGGDYRRVSWPIKIIWR